MDKIIYEIDNWTIVKLLGGVAVITIAVIGFFSKYLSTKLSQASQHSYDKRLEDLRGEILRSNNLLNSITNSYFSSSQKIVDKKMVAYELIWTIFSKTRENMPTGVSIIYELMHDDEIEKDTAFNELDNNPKVGPVLRSHNQLDEMTKVLDTTKELTNVRIYLSEKSYTLLKSYQAFVFRITHMFIIEYEKQKIFQWKKDEVIMRLINSNFTENEIKYLNNIKVGTLSNVLNLFEYKILNDIKKNLLITDSENDSIAYLKELQKKVITV